MINESNIMITKDIKTKKQDKKQGTTSIKQQNDNSTYK